MELGSGMGLSEVDGSTYSQSKKATNYDSAPLGCARDQLSLDKRRSELMDIPNLRGHG